MDYYRQYRQTDQQSNTDSSSNNNHSSKKRSKIGAMFSAWNRTFNFLPLHKRVGYLILAIIFVFIAVRAIPSARREHKMQSKQEQID